MLTAGNGSFLRFICCISQSDLDSCTVIRLNPESYAVSVLRKINSLNNKLSKRICRIRGYFQRFFAVIGMCRVGIKRSNGVLRRPMEIVPMIGIQHICVGIVRFKAIKICTVAYPLSPIFFIAKCSCGN